MRAQTKLVLILLLMAQAPFAYCDTYYGADRNIYPAHTPRTYIPREANYNTQFTVDITPKYWMVKPEPIDWRVRLQVDILDDNKVSRIVIVVWVPDPVYTDFNSGTVFILDSGGTPVGEMVKNYYSCPGEEDSGWFYLGVVETDGYFEKGEYFYVEFEEHDEQVVHCLSHYTASGNMEKEGVDRIYTWLVRGSKFLTVPQNPMFATPEYPLGTIASLFVMVGALIFWKRKHRRTRDSMKVEVTVDIPERHP
jgi:hypothetical protein